MTQSADAPETILIVDDEEPVRRTFHDWLAEARLDCEILTAHDAESALQLADRHTIDLAILDWALGAGDDGLQLLQDLFEFNPHVLAIMITGFANQATPLDAMRMGVRDYLDKNQDLSRETFLHAVRKQLDVIRPAKRERRLHAGLMDFREAVEKIVPLVQSAAALNDPVPLPEAVGSLFRFLMRATGAGDGALLVRHYDSAAQPAESLRAYDAAGKAIAAPLVPFARSLAASVASMQEACAWTDLDKSTHTSQVDLQPFEMNRHSVLAAPMLVSADTLAVMELFDKDNGAFTLDDQRLVGAAAEFGAEMLRQALAGRQTQRVLLDAVAAALGASDSVARTLKGKPTPHLEEPPPAAVLERLRTGLSATLPGSVPPEDSLRLAEAVRELALRHGPAAVQHCTVIVENLRNLLDKLTADM
ncbi:MAG: response regulator [Planctomycetes bacterium]|nr:response regulator [Planctomycetota bacterium]